MTDSACLFFFFEVVFVFFSEVVPNRSIVHSI
jgi:hypothetical protein